MSGDLFAPQACAYMVRVPTWCTPCRGLKVGIASLPGIQPAGEPDAWIPPPAEEGVRSLFKQKHNMTSVQRPPEESDAGTMQPGITTKPRIAMIVDFDDWAFANIARQVQAALSDEFSFDIIPLALAGDVGQTFMMAEHADIIHVFFRELVRSMYEDFSYHFETNGLGYDYFRDRFLRPKVITASVYCHQFTAEADIKARFELFNSYVNSYYVSSQRLFDIYSSVPALRPPAAVLSDGVDLQHFRPMNLDRFARIGERPIVVGWVGDSQWCAGHLSDPKGVNSLLKPALAELQDEGVQLVANFADRANGMTPYVNMPHYYRGIDLLVCASEIEGTPNPVLEAMACGVPVVSTDVGVVPEVFGPLQQTFILPVRNKTELKDAIRRLLHDPSLFAALSAENLEYIRDWDWPLKAAKFRQFFRNALEANLVKLARARPRD